MTPTLSFFWFLLVSALASSAAPPFDRERLLVFTRTTGFRHDSIPDAIAAVRQMAAESGLTVDATEDPAVFHDVGLSPYRAMVFLLTTGDVLGDEEKRAFERWLAAGRGWVGVHSASDTEYDWPLYGQLVGAYFAGHPAVQSAVVHVEDRAHPATRTLPETWFRTDEWYDFRSNPRPRVHVLATLDEATYAGGSMGADHPIAWCREVAGGRAFYTAGGHTRESYAEPLFVAHLAGG
nr:ThuA domain-containing protein [Acidobacteriota bacterium]